MLPVFSRVRSVRLRPAWSAAVAFHLISRGHGRLAIHGDTGLCARVQIGKAERRQNRVCDHRELGRHCRAARQRPVAQLSVPAADRCRPLATVAKRCLGHAEAQPARTKPVWASGDDHQFACWVTPVPTRECRASPGRRWPRWRGRLVGLLPSGGGRRVGRCVGLCVARPCGIQTSLFPPCRRDGSRHCSVLAVVVSMACSSLASSASISPIATRSSGLMNPSLSRKPPARAIASRSGTAQ